MTIYTLDDRHVIDITTFKELPKPTIDEQQMEFDREYKRDVQTYRNRMKEHYGGGASGSEIDHFIQVECGFKHTLLLNKRGQVFAFGNGLQG